MPDPSRRPTASGRSTAAPLAAAARAGPVPTQASTSVSSPLRNRWQRTPPVPRPLAGYSANGVTFTAPGSVPGSAVLDPETRDDDGRVVRLEGAEQDNVLAGGDADAGHAAAGAALRAHRPAPKCSSWASEVTKQSSSSPLRSSTAPTTSSPSARRMTSHASRLPSTSGFTRLTTPVAGAERDARRSRSSSEVEREHPLAGLERQELADRRAALQVRVVGGRRQRGQVEHVEPHAAGRGW